MTITPRFSYYSRHKTTTNTKIGSRVTLVYGNLSRSFRRKSQFLKEVSFQVFPTVPLPIGPIRSRVKLSILARVARLQRLSPMRGRDVLHYARSLRINLWGLQAMILTGRRQSVVLRAMFLYFNSRLQSLLGHARRSRTQHVLLSYTKFFLRRTITRIRVLYGIRNRVNVRYHLPHLTALPIFIITVRVPIQPTNVRVYASIMQGIYSRRLHLKSIVKLRVLRIIVSRSTFCVERQRPHFPTQESPLPQASTSNHRK